MSAILVGVIGAGACDPSLASLAYTVGYELAYRNYVLVCGGLGGVMAAACQGAKAAGGTTVGILPGTDPQAANPWVDVVIPTGLGEARNAVIVRTAQALVAIAGGYGTLSEIGFALKLGKPLVGLHTWQPISPTGETPPFPQATTPKAAVEWLETHLSSP